jgi:hypothetical protein
MGNIVILFLAIQNLQSDGMTYTGTTRSCGTTLPDLTLSAAAQIVTMGMKVSILIPDSTFDAIPRTFNINGTQGAPGGSYAEAANIGGLGLVAGSMYLDPANPMAWPPDCASGGTTCNSTGSFMASDLVDDDADGNPGVTATPSSMSPYVLPPTSLLGTTSPADKVYIVLRQMLQLTGTRSMDGNSATGTAVLSLFDNHVVGCHTMANANCTSDEAAFVDQNRTKYTTQSQYMSSNPNPISQTNQVMGTFSNVKIANGSSCAAVRMATFP